MPCDANRPFNESGQAGTSVAHEQSGRSGPDDGKPKIDPHAVTISGYAVDNLYGPDSAAQRDWSTTVGEPGQFPYTRGIHPGMYRTRLWTMRQFAGFGSADDTNQRFKYLLNQASHAGTNTGLSTAFDLPTLMGRDSDDPLSTGEVGKCGVAIDTIDDMHRLYADIPLEEVTVSQTINGPAAVIWAMYLAMARQRGFDWNKLGGTIQNDILKEFHAQNEFIYPPEPSVKLVVDTIEFQSTHVPRWNSVSISGYHIREAGSTAVQELAFTLRDGMEYTEACIERGLDVDFFAPRLSYFFNSHNEFFEEICKLRAARRIWATAMRDRFKAKNPRSWLMRTHVQTAGCSLTEQQPLNNVIRVAYQAMAGVLGGCQSLHCDSFDETLGLPTEQAVTIALRTQQILAHETGVTRTADPLGGSYYVEKLTDQMEADANAIIGEIDDLGGVVAGINRGYFRRSIAEAAYRFGQECEAGDRIIVGVNGYVEENEERPCDILYIPHEVEVQQKERLADFKKNRDMDAVNRALDAIRTAARNDENVMPALVDGSDARCTLGEMVQAMADIYGRYNGGPEW
ncbi:MAG: methylmalonyl-CoA mutase [Planctomycetes bacterium]|nr:methylmalonyl-CoA mutase [Planctomycetota bacterium]NOG54090.1 methylmalonyl-CoA mutase [Planctomycetota bacterium]